jgi:amidase
VTTFILRLDDGPAGGERVAVKDCIDVAGVPTTSGCPAVADRAMPAPVDAACLGGLRHAGVRIVGKANLHELCFGSTGVNPWYGTPVNPLDPTRVPGGSSSGSTVAVMTEEADIGIGTDTTGSVRTPAAYCGGVGLRTTFGRVPMAGIQPLAPSLDTIGPIGRTVAACVRGMELLDPMFAPEHADARPPLVGRVRVGGVDGVIDAAIDAALASAELEVEDAKLRGWDDATNAGRTILFGEAWRSLGHLYSSHPDRIGADTVERFELAKLIDDAALDAAYTVQRVWRAELAAAFTRYGVLALPAVPWFAQRLDDYEPAPVFLAIPASIGGVPAVAVPVPTTESLPASLQLIGPAWGEAHVLALAARVEAAVNG